MKIIVIIFILIAGILSPVLADVKNVKESVLDRTVDAVASDKSSDSKPKRDASHLSGVYHGPSYKYLPPSSISSYDSYSGSTDSFAGFSSGHSSSIGGGYSTGGTGRVHNQFEFPSSSRHSSSHGLGYVPVVGYHSGGHRGLGFTSSSHYAGHGSGGIKGGVSFHNGPTSGYGDFSNNRPYSYAIGHGYRSSGSSFAGSGYKSHLHSVGGTHANSGSGYHYSKGIGGTFSSPTSSGFGSIHGLSSLHGSSSLEEEHQEDHVHNGAQDHVYVISSSPTGFGNSHSTVPVPQHGRHEVPSTSYLPPVQQHHLPSTSYGIPIEKLGDSYNKHYSHTSSALEHGPAYAAGHKGLGHFGFTANKPQVLHTSISGSNFQQPSYSEAPFKPSTFLGAKYEGPSHDVAPNQQYLPPSSTGANSAGYKYPIPSGPSINYQEPSYQQSIEVQTASVNEPESAYLTLNNNQDSFHEVPTVSSASYLPHSSTYGVPYSR